MSDAPTSPPSDRPPPPRPPPAAGAPAGEDELLEADGDEEALAPAAPSTGPAAAAGTAAGAAVGGARTETLVLGPEAAGKRLDRALADRFPGESRNVIQRWLAEGRVQVGGRALPPAAKMAGGEEVRVEVPAPRSTHLEPADIPLRVLFEDEHLVLLDKPSGLTVHPGAGRHADTLANALVHRYRHLPEAAGSDRPGIVHRLDKDTSGVLVVARSDAVQRALSLAFAERRVTKEYVALVHGAPRRDELEVDLPIGRCEAQRTKMRIDVEQGRAARTRFVVERRLARNALLRCFPHTGRTHQIRVHLMTLQHPVVGDRVYGPRSWPWSALAPRLMLHAHRLGFVHPVTGQALLVEAPLPADLEAALAALAELPPEPRRRPRPRGGEREQPGGGRA